MVFMVLQAWYALWQTKLCEQRVNVFWTWNTTLSLSGLTR